MERLVLVVSFTVRLELAVPPVPALPPPLVLPPLPPYALWLRLRLPPLADPVAAFVSVLAAPAPPAAPRLPPPP